MDLTKINTLSVIKKNKDPLVSKSITPNVTQVSANIPETELKVGISKSNVTQIPSKVNKVKKLYTDFRTGHIQKEDFERKIFGLEPKILKKMTSASKKEILPILVETLKWLIQIKILISTGKNPNTPNQNFPFLINNIIEKDTHNNEDRNSLINLIDKDPKKFSLEIYSFLRLFTEDDILNPKYKVDISGYLANDRPNFLKEIVVLFELYCKYYETVSKDIIDSIENSDFSNTQDENIQFQEFKKLSEVQPRFQMINKHILSSNLNEKITHNLDLTKIGILPEDPIEASKILGISASQLGLKKRLDNLNAWLINGIIMVQVSINRIYALKPISTFTPGALTVPGLKNFAAKNAENIYDIWLIIEDTKSFLESLKGLIDGKAFITGVPSNNMLDILNVNY